MPPLNIVFINYTDDDTPSDRTTEDVKAPNSFGRNILELCKSTGLRICNGRFGENSGKYTFHNKNGASVIDYLLMQHDCIHLIKSFNIENFNVFSCHAPLGVEIYMKGERVINDQCTCIENIYDTFKCNEGLKDDVANDLLMNAQRFDDLLVNITDHEDRIDECVEELNKLLTDIFDQYTKTEVRFTEYCDYCCLNKNFNRNIKNDKPWFTDECKNLYKQYKTSLDMFNKSRNNDNRLKLNLAKQRYKRLENKLKRDYKNQQGDMLKSLRLKNPKKFYRKFKNQRRKTVHSVKLQQFQEHFKELINRDRTNDEPDLHIAGEENNCENVFEELDMPFTEAELDRGLPTLKANKAPGHDTILNEYLSTGRMYLIPILCKLFNNVLNTGIFPEIWVKSIIIPVFKKGDINDPKNYRGISLVSHIGKFFTTLINKRLLEWSDQNNILTDAQFGFRPGFGSTDAIFALHSLINSTLRKGKRLYCCFVDYSNAFDSVSHYKLWQKLVRIGITGKLFNVIKSMYSKLKYCVKLNGKCSEFFNCSYGLMQGESLSPLLFSLYVNDMEIELIEK